MKMMKLALLGGAALAVMTAGAYADDLSALKGEIEALNARVAQLEATPSVPAGFSLVTISKGEAFTAPDLALDDKWGGTATIISVLPTADAPATTTIEWSGRAQAALYWNDSKTKYNHDDYYNTHDKTLDVLAQGRIHVVGKTDTAVGEVGALVEMRGGFDGHSTASVTMHEAWGWWAMTPELTLGGGYTGSLSNVGYGYDGACNCYYTDSADVALNSLGDVSQMRLTWASGPMSMAIALEESDFNSKQDTTVGVAGRLAYTGDMFNSTIDGGWRDGNGTFDDAYQAGAGVGFAIGDMASLSLGAAVGHTATQVLPSNPPDYYHLSGDNSGQNWWGASILASANLTDSVHAEAAYGHKHYGKDGVHIKSEDVDAVLAGIYYDPVSQLTIGLEGEVSRNTWKFNVDGNRARTNSATVDLVTVFRF